MCIRDRGKKIRDAEVRKAPYMLVVGDREEEGGLVAVRRHREGDIGQMATAEFVDRATEEVAARGRESVP